MCGWVGRWWMGGWVADTTAAMTYFVKTKLVAIKIPTWPQRYEKRRAWSPDQYTTVPYGGVERRGLYINLHTLAASSSFSLSRVTASTPITSRRRCLRPCSCRVTSHRELSRFEELASCPTCSDFVLYGTSKSCPCLPVSRPDQILDFFFSFFFFLLLLLLFFEGAGGLVFLFLVSFVCSFLFFFFLKFFSSLSLICCLFVLIICVCSIFVLIIMCL